MEIVNKTEVAPKAITNLSGLGKTLTIGHQTPITLNSCYLPGTGLDTHLMVHEALQELV